MKELDKFSRNESDDKTMVLFFLSEVEVIKQGGEVGEKIGSPVVSQSVFCVVNAYDGKKFLPVSP